MHSGKKKRDLDKTRGRILSAATKEFHAYGFAGARIDSIAKRARVNRAMVYYIFKKKQDLHLAVVESLLSDALAEVTPHLEKPDVSLTDVVHVLTIFYNHIIDNETAARIVAQDLINGAKTLRRLKNRRSQLFVYFDTVADSLQRMIRKKLFKPYDPNMVLLAVFITILFTACTLPHMDLVTEKGSKEHRRLSDKENWRAFFTEAAIRVVTPDSDNLS
ncbi:MAG: TetR/AcrR family transcriptional regulator [Deltaproteobacteria bacterium]|nr:TetR/AcrR family transcriptional regulator [Deltaproteobacteria bacterium]